MSSISSSSAEVQSKLQLFEEQVPVSVRLSMEKQGDALRSYEELCNSFDKDSRGLSVYPDEYAGAYVDNGNLVIQLTTISAAIKDRYIQKCGNSENISFRHAEYSLNDLLQIKAYGDESIREGNGIIGYGIDMESNQFEISMDENILIPYLSDNCSLAIYSGKPIKIVKRPSAQSCASIWGGDLLKNEDKGDEMTAGICGTYNGEKALLTCGHGNEKVGFWPGRYPYIQYDGSRIGQVSYQRANTSPMEHGVNALGDFAIVTLDDDVTTTSRIHGGVIISGTYSSLPQGATVYKYGQKTGYSYGTVTISSIGSATQYNNKWNMTYYVEGLFLCSMSNSSGTDAIDLGDSGGPVYTKDGSRYLLHGIVAACIDNPSQPNTGMYSSPIYYATDAGFTVKTS